MKCSNTDLKEPIIIRVDRKILQVSIDQQLSKTSIIDTEEPITGQDALDSNHKILETYHQQPTNASTIKVQNPTKIKPFNTHLEEKIISHDELSNNSKILEVSIDQKTSKTQKIDTGEPNAGKDAMDFRFSNKERPNESAIQDLSKIDIRLEPVSGKDELKTYEKRLKLLIDQQSSSYPPNKRDYSHFNASTVTSESPRIDVENLVTARESLNSCINRQDKTSIDQKTFKAPTNDVGEKISSQESVDSNEEILINQLVTNATTIDVQDLSETKTSNIDVEEPIIRNDELKYDNKNETIVSIDKNLSKTPTIDILESVTGEEELSSYEKRLKLLKAQQATSSYTNERDCVDAFTVMSKVSTNTEKLITGCNALNSYKKKLPTTSRDKQSINFPASNVENLITWQDSIESNPKRSKTSMNLSTRSHSRFSYNEKMLVDQQVSETLTADRHESIVGNNVLDTHENKSEISIHQQKMKSSAIDKETPITGQGVFNSNERRLNTSTRQQIIKSPTIGVEKTISDVDRKKFPISMDQTSSKTPARERNFPNFNVTTENLCHRESKVENHVMALVEEQENFESVNSKIDSDTFSKKLTRLIDSNQLTIFSLYAVAMSIPIIVVFVSYR